MMSGQSWSGVGGPAEVRNNYTTVAVARRLPVRHRGLEMSKELEPCCSAFQGLVLFALLPDHYLFYCVPHVCSSRNLQRLHMQRAVDNSSIATHRGYSTAAGPTLDDFKEGLAGRQRNWIVAAFLRPDSAPLCSHRSSLLSLLMSMLYLH